MSERICSNEELDRITTIEVRRRTSSKLQIMKHQFGFKSVDEMLSVLMAVVYRQQWSKQDILKMTVEYMSGSATNDDEVHENIGVKSYTQTTKIKGKVKEKPKEDERKGVND